MPRPLGRAAWLAYAPLRLAVARLRCTLARALAYLPAWAGGHAGLDAGISIQGYDSAFRVWRILGGGKMRQTL